MDEKSLMRKKLRARRALFVQPSERNVKDIHHTLRSHLSRLCADLIGGEGAVWSYVARGDEAPAEMERPLAFPRIEGEDLEFYIPKSKEAMKENAYGILEPQVFGSRRSEKPQVILVPGLGFDRRGGRLGSGKGFYDRLLRKNSRAIRVGVAYSVQVTDENLPTESHDQNMDWVVTENFILQCEGRDEKWK